MLGSGDCVDLQMSYWTRTKRKKGGRKGQIKTSRLLMNDLT